LEAIVGVLPSNYDKDDQVKIVERVDGSWLVDGRTPIEEIHISIGLEEISADEDFDTIAGFLLEALRRTPKEGVAFEDFGYRFEIVDMDGHRIDKILISRVGERKDEAA
jgi:putative hemolysin